MSIHGMPRHFPQSTSVGRESSLWRGVLQKTIKRVSSLAQRILGSFGSSVANKSDSGGLFEHAVTQTQVPPRPQAPPIKESRTPPVETKPEEKTKYLDLDRVDKAFALHVVEYALEEQVSPGKFADGMESHIAKLQRDYAATMQQEPVRYSLQDYKIYCDSRIKKFCEALSVHTAGELFHREELLPGIGYVLVLEGKGGQKIEDISVSLKKVSLEEGPPWRKSAEAINPLGQKIIQSTYPLQPSAGILFRHN